MKELEIEKIFPLALFTSLLREHVQSFRRLEVLQVQFLQKSQQSSSEGLTELIAQFTLATETLQAKKNALRPLLEKLSQFEKTQRQKILMGEAETLLAELETLAQGIQVRHADSFETAPLPPAGLEERLNLYRGMK